MKLEITKDEYEIMWEFLELHSIEVDIHSIITDEVLVALGFAEKVPCIVELDISDEEIDRICEICGDYDLAAALSEELQKSRWDPVARKLVREQTEAQKLYHRYGLIYTYFMD